MINRRFWIYLLIAIVLVASVALLGMSLLRLRQSNQTIASLRSVNSSLQERLTAQSGAGTDQLKEELENTKAAYMELETQLAQANESVKQLTAQAEDREETDAKL